MFLGHQVKRRFVFLRAGLGLDKPTGSRWILGLADSPKVGGSQWVAARAGSVCKNRWACFKGERHRIRMCGSAALGRCPLLQRWVQGKQSKTLPSPRFHNWSQGVPSTFVFVWGPFHVGSKGNQQAPRHGVFPLRHKRAWCILGRVPFSCWFNGKPRGNQPISRLGGGGWWFMEKLVPPSFSLLGGSPLQNASCDQRSHATQPPGRAGGPGAAPAMHGPGGLLGPWPGRAQTWLREEQVWRCPKLWRTDRIEVQQR